MKTTTLLAAWLALCAAAAPAAPLSESTVTEIVRDVNVVVTATKSAQPAAVNAVVRAPDLVRTAAESRAELTAPDQTITRIGANTVFSFEGGGRTINLQQGSLLFHSPKGKGGGTIKSGGASAAVLGTTLLVAATVQGAFKVIVIEGRGRVTPRKGRPVTLDAGEMVYVLPTGELSGVLKLHLSRLVAGSLLVNGFERPLPSMPAIQAAVTRQERDIARGRMAAADDPAERVASGRLIEQVDENTYKVNLQRLLGGQGSVGQIVAP